MQHRIWRCGKIVQIQKDATFKLELNEQNEIANVKLLAVEIDHMRQEDSDESDDDKGGWMLYDRA